MELLLVIIAVLSPILLEPCPTEVGNGCYWDANGSGSFTSLDDGTVIYWPEGM